MNYRWILFASACFMSFTLLTACQEKEEKQDHYRVGSKVSDAYVNPNTINKVAKEDMRAVGFDYDYDSLTYDLVWSDEFDYEGPLDDAKWSYEIGGHGWGNNEMQYYTKGNNAYIKDGSLIIEARNEEWEGMDYTSSRIVTKGKGDWLYGKFEIKAKLPTGVGTWPAIWMLPTEGVYGSWPNSGEIDIMEHVGYNPNVIHASIHTKAYNHIKGTQKTTKKYIETATDDFHVYTVEWLPDKIMAYVDGQLYYTYDPLKFKSTPTYAEWPFDQKMYLLLNIAVGGNWGGVKGIDTSVYPQQMLIDYVRVYQSKEIKELIQG